MRGAEKMNKKILEQYIDACAQIRETEAEIKKLKKERKTFAQDIVKSSNKDFPYQQVRAHVEGTSYLIQDSASLAKQKKILAKRKKQAERIRQQVEEWMLTIPIRMQRIIRMRFFEGKTWQQVAESMGRSSSEYSVKKEFERFMREKKTSKR